MKLHKLFLSCVCLLSLLMAAGQGWAQKMPVVVIRGNADFAIGEEIRLLAYEDLITYTPKVVSSDVIDKKGAFELSYSTAEEHLVLSWNHRKIMISISRWMKNCSNSSAPRIMALFCR